MYAYTANLKESGKGSFEDTVLKAVVAKAVKDAESRSDTWSFSEKFDWTKIVNDLMESSYHYGDLKGYIEWKKFLGFWISNMLGLIAREHITQYCVW